jgi:hypothetical protein
MTESTKTISTAAVAAALLVLAIVSRPKLPYAEKEGEVGQPLFTEWKDPTAAKSMAIATFDDATQSVRDFKVALVDGKWCIPSHGNYPANAEDHVVKAASDLINLKVIEVVSDAQGSHETYGVVEPDPVKLKQPAVGVGKLVTVKDKDGKDLAKLIIGKEDKPAGGSESTSNLRFVRRAGQDRVYKVALATDLFSTKFPDWIDSDLLGLKQHWDITKLQIRDYNLEDRGTEDHREISVARKSDIALEYNDPKASWTVSKLTEYKNDKPSESKLAADEELDTGKLNDAKMNLSGLKIADVNRKPAVLAERLKKSKDFYGDAESQDSLANKGFVPLPEKKPTDVFSAGGDVTVGMKDGVEYTIRFGGVGLALREKDETKDKKAAMKSTDDQKRTNAERVVFVTARFNEDLIAKPTLEPLPEAKKSDETKPDAAKVPGKAPATTPAPATSPAPGKAPDSKTPPNKKSADSKRSDMLLALADDPPAKASAKQPEVAKPSAPNPVTAKPDDKQPAARPADSKPASDAKKPDADKTAPSDIKRADEEKALDEQRLRVETENKRKQDEYDASVKKGKEHAKQLNDRFADWYFLISDEDYKKVHVGPADIIKKKAPPEGATGPGLGTIPTDPFQKGK